MSGAIAATVIGGSIAAAGGIGSAAIQSHAAGKAADAQSQAAQQAADYQRQAGQQAVDYQRQQNQQTQQNLSPYQNAGTGALSNLSRLLGVGGQSNVAQGTNTPYQPNGAQPQQAQIGNGGQQIYNPNGTQPINAQSGVQTAQPGVSAYNPSGAAQPVGNGGNPQAVQSGQIAQSGSPQAGSTDLGGGYGSLLTPYQDFSAPTDITMQNDPGYQARLKLGTDALQHSAAARGNVLTGGVAKALDTYAQDFASTEYGNVYNRALSSYGTNQGNYYTGQNNTYNRLMGLVNSGQNAATSASSLGQSGANSVASTLTGNARDVNQQTNNAAAATASGYAANGNIWGNAVSGAGNNIGNLYALQNNKYGANSNYALPTYGAVPTSTLNSYSYEPDYAAGM